MLNLFLKRSPFIRLIIPLITGIYVAFQIPEHQQELLFAVLIAFLCFASVSYWFKHAALYQYRYITGFAGFMLFFLFAMFYMQMRMPQTFSLERKQAIKLQLVENIGETNKNYKYEAILLAIDNDSLAMANKSRGIVFIPKKQEDKTLYPGAVIHSIGRFIPFSEPDCEFDFDYSGYLRNQRIAFRFIISEYQKLSNQGVSNSLFIQSARLKLYLRERFVSAGLTKSQVAILNALFLGDKSKLTYEQKVAFSNAGAMHLLAVSGLHVGIIYMLIISLLTALGLKKGNVAVACLVISILWLYAFITGFSPSVLRASLMFTILEIGRISKRKTGIFNLLGASMFIIMIIEPLSIFNIGFWLSHSAVAAIVCFYPKINSWFRFRFPPFRWFWSITAVSLAAQIGTLPICIYAFYGFPLYFVITNLMLIPVVTPILVLAVFSSVFSFSSFVLAVLVPALGDLLTFMEQTALYIESLPNSIITNLYLNSFQLLGIYTSIIFLLVYVDYRFVRYLKYALISLIIALASVYIRKERLPDELLYVANVKGKSVVNYLNASTNIIYTNEELTEKEIDFAFGGLWAYCLANSKVSTIVVDKQNYRPIVKLIGNQRIAIVSERAVWEHQMEHSHIDLLILLGKPEMTLAELRASMRVRQLVISNGWKWYHKRKWLKEHSTYIENVHDISKDGVLFVVDGKLM
ncbi:ComEC/Rec2 family competence protein [Carboxylicivirga sp. A043]|uniref:ComEC/Rec2 family competence protein n=1 Tax=Carboxylicivirga litoralis TaxID=2816963 RepID=UPI0021CB46FF|nr:ComEC/Rec2 family competence protein [Carboxylicivirga sp. A043]MCU4155375.1 ComEC/Rec2 family competence protein [Carboxylicivirga sp. A043]